MVLYKKFLFFSTISNKAINQAVSLFIPILTLQIYNTLENFSKYFSTFYLAIQKMLLPLHRN